MVKDFLMLSRFEIIGILIMYFALVIFILVSLSLSLTFTHTRIHTYSHTHAPSLMHKDCVGGFSKELRKRQQR